MPTSPWSTFPAGDLRQRMKAPLVPATALHFLEQIASALEAIHSVGVLHRDLKPANVMLRADGSLCLIDFGLAKANELDAELTGTREIFGTPYYMSPEQGHAELIDARSDLYSLGVIFYEMLTGRKPYTGRIRHGSHLQAQARGAAGHRPAVRELRADFCGACWPSRRRTGSNRRARSSMRSPNCRRPA